MLISKHTKITGTMAAVLFLCTSASLFAFAYHINNTNKLLNELKVEREQAQANRQELNTLVSLMEETVAERDELSRYILKHDEVITFLALIETLGREQGTELRTSSLTVVEKEGIFEELQVTVSVNGTNQSVLQLLTIFESLPYQSYVSSVSLTEGSGNLWNASFTLHVTKFKES